MNYLFTISRVQLMKDSEQHRFENMRSLLDDKTRELITLQKQLRQQITRLVSHLTRIIVCGIIAGTIEKN